MKYLVMVTPRAGQIPPAGSLEASLAWIQARLADKTFDCCYSFVTGGGIAIMNAESNEAVAAHLTEYPGRPFADMRVEPLCDLVASLERVIAMLKKANP